MVIASLQQYNEYSMYAWFEPDEITQNTRFKYIT